MVTFLIIIGVLGFVFYSIGNSKTNKKTQRVVTRKENNNEKIPTVTELIKEIETIDELNSFEKQLEKVFEKYSEDYDNKYYERLHKRYEDAFYRISEKISNKVFYYQYIPDLDLDTLLKDLKLAYSYFIPEEYKSKKKGTSSENWLEITGNELIEGAKIEDVIEKKPKYFETLVNFRNIIESKKKLNEKLLAITEIAKNDSSFKNKFFNNNNYTIEIQCLIWLLEPYRIPLLNKLIELEYNTIEKLCSLTTEQLEKINGFGKNRIEQFKISINNINKSL